MNNKRDMISSLFASIFAIAFAIVWIFIAGRIAKIMIIFGVIFIGIAIVNIVKVISIYRNRQKYNENEYNEVTFDAEGRTRDYYYKNSIVSRSDEQFVTIYNSKWYSMM